VASNVAAADGIGSTTIGPPQAVMRAATMTAARVAHEDHGSRRTDRS
jgi:hypothetical protein